MTMIDVVMNVEMIHSIEGKIARMSDAKIDSREMIGVVVGTMIEEEMNGTLEEEMIVIIEETIEGMTVEMTEEMTGEENREMTVGIGTCF
jgi:hypothetical protein